MLDLSFEFTGECWLWSAQNQVSWHFVTLPQDKSEEIKFFSENLQGKRRGWGAVRVIVTIGKTRWETSIFPSKSHAAYILPIKSEVRKKEKFSVGDCVNIKLQINI